jgi:hypothetical protein
MIGRETLQLQSTKKEGKFRAMTGEENRWTRCSTPAILNATIQQGKP